MSQLLQRFSLEYARYTSQIYLAVAGLWLVVLLCVISSVLAQPFTGRQRLFWLAVVILVPLLGTLAYLPFSIPRDELPQMFMLKKGKSRRGGDLPPKQKSS